MTALDQIAPLSTERLTEVKAAYGRSLYESMSIGPNLMTVWGAVPELAAEIERLRCENAGLSEDLRRALGEVADHA